MAVLTLKLIVTFAVVMSIGCDDYLKKWNEKREAQRQEEEAKKRPDYIPPHCRHPYGLYRVYSGVSFNHPACAQVFGFFNNQVAWWGGTNFYGPGHKATRVRKDDCKFEYAGDGFAGTEERTRSGGAQRPADEGKLMITYEGTWTGRAPPGMTGTCVATGWEQFIKE